MRRWILACLALLGVGVLLVIDFDYRSDVRRVNDAALTQSAFEIARRMQFAVNARLRVVGDFEAFMLAGASLPDKDTFNRYAVRVLGHYPEIRALQYVDSDRFIRYIYPLEGNEEALGLDLTTRPAASFVEAAVRERRTTVNDPTVTVQGSLSVVARSPLFREDRLLGLVQAVFDVHTVVEEISTRMDPRFAMQLRDVRGRRFWGTDRFGDATRQFTVKVGDNAWTGILGWRVPPPRANFRELLLIWAMGGALLVSLLYIVHRAMAYTGALRAAVAERTASLRESEERYRLLVDNCEEGIMLTTPDGGIDSVNPAACRILGRSEVEIRSLGRAGMVDENDPRVRAAVEERNRTGRFSGELSLVRRDGSIFPAEVSTAIFKDARGSERTSMLIRDVSERKRMESERALLAAVVRSSSDAIISRDSDYRITSWNPGAEHLFGYAAHEAIGRNMRLLYPEDKFEEVRHYRKMIDANLSIPPYDTVRLTKDGRRIDVSLAASPIVDESSRVVGASLIVRDIAERKRAEAEHALLAAIVASSQDAIICRDLGWRVLLWNQGAERLFGYAAQEIIGKDVGVVVPEDKKNEVDNNRARLADDQPVPPHDTVRVARDGRRIDVSIAQSPIRDPAGRMTGVSLVIRDITERKRVEERLRASLDEKEALMREIHHRVKNNMQVMSALLELQSAYVKDETAIAQMRDSQMRIQSMAMIHQQLYRGRDATHVDFVDYLRQLVDHLRGQHGALLENRVRIRVDVQPCTLAVDTAVTLGLVANELINNAIKHAFPGGRCGTLHVRLYRTSVDRTVLQVADDGVGMDEQALEKRAEGFGMRLLKLMVEDQLGGTLRIETVAGTRVTCEFGDQR